MWLQKNDEARLSTKNRWLRRLAILAALGVLAVALLVTGAATLAPVSSNVSAETAARVLSATGRVTAYPKTAAAQKVARTNSAKALRAGDSVAAGWEVVTGPDSRTELEVSGPARISLGPTSAVLVAPGSSYRGQDGQFVQPTVRVSVGTVLVHVMKGVARLVQFSVETPTAVAGVRGTIFDVRVYATSTKVSVWEGQVAVQAVSATGKLPAGAVMVQPGEQVEVYSASKHANKTKAADEFRGLWAPRQGWVKQQHDWEQIEKSRSSNTQGNNKLKTKEPPPGQIKVDDATKQGKVDVDSSQKNHGWSFGWFKKKTSQDDEVNKNTGNPVDGGDKKTKDNAADSKSNQGNSKSNQDNVRNISGIKAQSDRGRGSDQKSQQTRQTNQSNGTAGRNNGTAVKNGKLSNTDQ